jgi:hypothetical protein
MGIFFIVHFHSINQRTESSLWRLIQLQTLGNSPAKTYILEPGSKNYSLLC